MAFRASAAASVPIPRPGCNPEICIRKFAVGNVSGKMIAGKMIAAPDLRCIVDAMRLGGMTQTITVAITGAVMACSPSVTSELPMSKPNNVEAALAASVYQQVNAYRSNHRVRGLQRDATLDRLAQQHSMFLSKNRGKFSIYGPNVSHYGFEERAFVAKNLYHMDQVGENVASTNKSGSQIASYLVNLWINSPTHEHNMRVAWTYTGVGVVVADDGMVFATQMFGSLKAQSHMDMLNRLRRH
jgi:uncharacterized protein YkwD